MEGEASIANKDSMQSAIALKRWERGCGRQNQWRDDEGIIAQNLGQEISKILSPGSRVDSGSRVASRFSAFGMHVGVPQSGVSGGV